MYRNSDEWKCEYNIIIIIDYIQSVQKIKHKKRLVFLVYQWYSEFSLGIYL